MGSRGWTEVISLARQAFFYPLSHLTGPPTLFSPWTWSSLIWPGWLASKLQGSACLCTGICGEGMGAGVIGTCLQTKTLIYIKIIMKFLNHKKQNKNQALLTPPTPRPWLFLFVFVLHLELILVLFLCVRHILHKATSPVLTSWILLHIMRHYPSCFGYRNTDVRVSWHPVVLALACAGGAQPRVGGRAFSHEYLQSYVHSISSIVSFHSRWRQQWKGETFIRKSLFVLQLDGALQAWEGEGDKHEHHCSLLLLPAAQLLSSRSWIWKG